MVGLLVQLPCGAYSNARNALQDGLAGLCTTRALARRCHYGARCAFRGSRGLCHRPFSHLDIRRQHIVAAAGSTCSSCLFSSLVETQLSLFSWRVRNAMPCTCCLTAPFGAPSSCVWLRCCCSRCRHRSRTLRCRLGNIQHYCNAGALLAHSRCPNLSGEKDSAAIVLPRPPPSRSTPRRCHGARGWPGRLLSGLTRRGRRFRVAHFPIWVENVDNVLCSSV